MCHPFLSVAHGGLQNFISYTTVRYITSRSEELASILHSAGFILGHSNSSVADPPHPALLCAVLWQDYIPALQASHSHLLPLNSTRFRLEQCSMSRKLRNTKYLT